MEPHWLDEREMRAWRGFHRLRAELVAHLARELARDSGLTEADYAVLVQVSEAPGRRMRSRDLAQALRWDRSRISHQLGRMEARGTVRRESCAEDGRSFNVVLTDAGMAAIEAAAPAHVAAARHCFIDILTPEQLDTLGDIAEAITTHLATEHNDPSNGDEGSVASADTSLQGRRRESGAASVLRGSGQASRSKGGPGHVSGGRR